jgi:hypothetical protein
MKDCGPRKRSGCILIYLVVVSNAPGRLGHVLTRLKANERRGKYTKLIRQRKINGRLESVQEIDVRAGV